MQVYYRCIRLCFASVAFYAILLMPVLAAENNKIAVLPVSGKIHVDGILNDAAWQANPSIANLTQVEPRPGEPPTEVYMLWIGLN